MRLMPKPSRRVKIAMMIAARNERPKEIPNAERCVALMKRPPVLHRIAAPSTSNRGELLIFHFSFDISHLPSCQKPDRKGGPLDRKALANARASDTLTRDLKMRNGKFSSLFDYEIDLIPKCCRAEHSDLPDPREATSRTFQTGHSR